MAKLTQDISDQLDRTFAKLFPSTAIKPKPVEEKSKPYKLPKMCRVHQAMQQDPDTADRAFYLLYGL